MSHLIADLKAYVAMGFGGKGGGIDSESSASAERLVSCTGFKGNILSLVHPVLS
jgi:hypothetical protein